MGSSVTIGQVKDRVSMPVRRPSNKESEYCGLLEEEDFEKGPVVYAKNSHNTEE